jgi:[ribosomal protein S18]-alanine N-acetyltransferase
VTGGVFVARAGPLDAPALARLQAACHSHPWTLEQVEAEIAQGPPGSVLVARSGDGIRAACAYRVLGDEAEVLDVCVEPSARRGGLGRLLVRLAMARAARAGARTARLEVRVSNEPARRLYASLGFRERGLRRGYYSAPVEDAVLLEAPLPDC